MKAFNHKKAVQALNLIAIWGGGEQNKMKALKLLWLADRYHLRKFGRAIFKDYYLAMENGPVASGARDILEENAFGAGQDAIFYASTFLAQTRKWFYKSINDTNEKVFSKSDLEALNIVFKTYGHLNQFELSDLTHEFPEWKRWEEGLLKKEYKFHPMDYNDFFLDVNDQYNLFNDDKKRVELTHKIFSRQGE